MAPLPASPPTLNVLIAPLVVLKSKPLVVLTFTVLLGRALALFNDDRAGRDGRAAAVGIGAAQEQRAGAQLAQAARAADGIADGKHVGRGGDVEATIERRPVDRVVSQAGDGRSGDLQGPAVEDHGCRRCARLLLAEMLSSPPASVVPPPKLLLPASVSVPVPVLVRPPGPDNKPASVTALPRVLMVPLPPPPAPVKVMAWLVENPRRPQGFRCRR